MLPFRDIFPARNSTRYLLEEPREPGTRLGNNAPEDILERERAAGGMRNLPISSLAVSNFNLYQVASQKQSVLLPAEFQGDSKSRTVDEDRRL